MDRFIVSAKSQPVEVTMVSGASIVAAGTGCHGVRDAAQRQACAGRHKQVELARARGVAHIGVKAKGA